ncbi:hypothetical protein MBLNU459_g3439t2 [Dothideomycetes sp. NU459]
MAYPLTSPWAEIEGHIRNMDAEMCEYLMDYPVCLWVIEQHEAHRAYKAMLERSDLWHLNGSIFSSDGFPTWQTTPCLASEPTLLTGHAQSGFSLLQNVQGSTPGYHYGERGPPVPAVARGVIHYNTYPSPGNGIPGTELAIMQDTTPYETQNSTAFDKTLAKPSRKRKRIPATTYQETSNYGIPPYPTRANRPAKVNSACASHDESCLGCNKCEWPWQRSFASERASEWADTIYPAWRLTAMEQTRERNKTRLESFQKSAPKFSDVTETAEPQVNTDKTKPGPKGEAITGRLVFLNKEGEEKAKLLGCQNVGEAIEASMAKPYDERFSAVEVCYNPEKPNILGLEPLIFSVMDAARTKLQLIYARILSDKAAERVIDFCPDELKQKLLLKVVSETSFSNTKLTRRLQLNGDPIVTTSVTHRIQSALGKRQKNKYSDGEIEWYLANRQDFNAYKDFHTGTAGKAYMGFLPSASPPDEPPTVKPSLKVAIPLLVHPSPETLKEAADTTIGEGQPVVAPRTTDHDQAINLQSAVGGLTAASQSPINQRTRSMLADKSSLLGINLPEMEGGDISLAIPPVTPVAQRLSTASTSNHGYNLRDPASRKKTRKDL